MKWKWQIFCEIWGSHSDAAEDRVFWDMTLCQEDRSYWLNMLEDMGIGKEDVHNRLNGE
jgi:hypothetical protein